MNKDSVLKLKAAFLYILNKRESVSILHVSKILYFANKEHLAKYGRNIIDDVFYSFPKGPVPTNLYNAYRHKLGDFKPDFFDEIINKPILDCFEVGEADYSFMLTAKETPDIDELSKSDILCLDANITKYIDMDFNKLSDESHDEAWSSARKINKNNGVNPMDYLLIAKSGGAKDGMISYIKEMRDVEIYLKK